MTHAVLLLLHGGDDRMDLIYFWASILMVALPITIFAVLTYLFTRGYWKRRTEAGFRSQDAGVPPNS